MKVAGRSRYVYRAIDQFGQVIDVLVSPRRDVAAARRFFAWAIGSTKVTPVEVVTDQAATYPIVLEELQPAAWHRIDRYANNRVEADHRRLKARLGPMRGLKQDANARVIIRRHAFCPDLRRGHYELAAEEPVTAARRSPSASSRSQTDPKVCGAFSMPRVGTTQQTRPDRVTTSGISGREGRASVRTGAVKSDSEARIFQTHILKCQASL